MAILIYDSGGGEGTSVADTTAVQSDVLPGKYFYLADGTRVEGSMATKAASTIIPSTTNQTINANQYLSGAQTIQGSANLKAENIKSGVNIFGKIGTFKDKTLRSYIKSDFPKCTSNSGFSGTMTVEAGFVPTNICIYSDDNVSLASGLVSAYWASQNGLSGLNWSQLEIVYLSSKVGWGSGYVSVNCSLSGTTLSLTFGREDTSIKYVTNTVYRLLMSGYY